MEPTLRAFGKYSVFRTMNSVGGEQHYHAFKHSPLSEQILFIRHPRVRGAGSELREPTREAVIEFKATPNDR